jgi:hypothetical protein
LDAGKAVLEHHFDEHKYCGNWCPRKRQTNEQLASSDRYYRCKTKDAKLYATLHNLISRFVTLERLREVGHSMDTQVNESLNNTIAWLAPKNKCYGGSQSLNNRISIAVGISTLGYNKFFVRMFHALGITMTPNIQHFLDVKEKKRSRRIAKAKTREAKKDRNKSRYDKLRKEERLKRMAKKRKDGTYRTGMNMDDDDDGGGKQPATKKRNSQADVVCKHCGKKGHSRTSSKQCLKYKAPTARKEQAQGIAVGLDQANDEDNADDLDDYERIPLELLQQDEDSGDERDADADDEDNEVQQLNVL